MNDVYCLNWVPGTMDRVLARSARATSEVSLAFVREVLGREALEGLYLRGHFQLSLEAQRHWATSRFAWPAYADAAD